VGAQGRTSLRPTRIVKLNSCITPLRANGNRAYGRIKEQPPRTTRGAFEPEGSKKGGRNGLAQKLHLVITTNGISKTQL